MVLLNICQEKFGLACLADGSVQVDVACNDEVTTPVRFGTEALAGAQIQAAVPVRDPTMTRCAADLVALEAEHHVEVRHVDEPNAPARVQLALPPRPRALEGACIVRYFAQTAQHYVSLLRAPSYIHATGKAAVPVLVAWPRVGLGSSPQTPLWVHPLPPQPFQLRPTLQRHFRLHVADAVQLLAVESDHEDCVQWCFGVQAHLQEDVLRPPNQQDTLLWVVRATPQEVGSTYAQPLPQSLVTDLPRYALRFLHHRFWARFFGDQSPLLCRDRFRHHRLWLLAPSLPRPVEVVGPLGPARVWLRWLGRKVTPLPLRLILQLANCDIDNSLFGARASAVTLRTSPMKWPALNSHAFRYLALEAPAVPAHDTKHVLYHLSQANVDEAQVQVRNGSWPLLLDVLQRALAPAAETLRDLAAADLLQLLARSSDCHDPAVLPWLASFTTATTAPDRRAAVGLRPGVLQGLFAVLGGWAPKALAQPCYQALDRARSAEAAAEAVDDAEAPTAAGPVVAQIEAVLALALAVLTPGAPAERPQRPLGALDRFAAFNFVLRVTQGVHAAARLPAEARPALPAALAADRLGQALLDALRAVLSPIYDLSHMTPAMAVEVAVGMDVQTPVLYGFHLLVQRAFTRLVERVIDAQFAVHQSLRQTILAHAGFLTNSDGLAQLIDRLHHPEHVTDGLTLLDAVKTLHQLLAASEPGDAIEAALLQTRVYEGMLAAGQTILEKICRPQHHLSHVEHILALDAQAAVFHYLRVFLERSSDSTFGDVARRTKTMLVVARSMKLVPHHTVVKDALQLFLRLLYRRRGGLHAAVTWLLQEAGLFDVVVSACCLLPDASAAPPTAASVAAASKRWEGFVERVQQEQAAATVPPPAAVASIVCIVEEWVTLNRDAAALHRSRVLLVSLVRTATALCRNILFNPRGTGMKLLSDTTFHYLENDTKGRRITTVLLEVGGFEALLDSVIMTFDAMFLSIDAVALFCQLLAQSEDRDAKAWKAFLAQFEARLAAHDTIAPKALFGLLQQDIVQDALCQRLKAPRTPASIVQVLLRLLYLSAHSASYLTRLHIKGLQPPCRPLLQSVVVKHNLQHLEEAKFILALFEGAPQVPQDLLPPPEDPSA